MGGFWRRFRGLQTWIKCLDEKQSAMLEHKSSMVKATGDSDGETRGSGQRQVDRHRIEIPAGEALSASAGEEGVTATSAYSTHSDASMPPLALSTRSQSPSSHSRTTTNFLLHFPSHARPSVRSVPRRFPRGFRPFARVRSLVVAVGVDG